MRILVLAPHAYYVDRGTPIDVDILVQALCARGHLVDLVVYRDGEDRQYPGLTIHRVKTPSWLGSIGPGFSVKKVVADLHLIGTAYELLSRNQYDVIHAGEEAVFLAMWIRFWRGLPYVYDMDSSVAQQLVEQRPWLRPLSRLFTRCESMAIRSALAVAPVCNALADLARERGARHVTTLHDISLMTTDDFDASYPSLRERLGVRDLIIMYVGNLEPYQGIDLLLQAFRRALAQAGALDLVVAGGTPEHIRHYSQMARRLGIDHRTHFIGAWPVTRLAELLVQADILTAPRIRGLNTPMKIFPYAHSGRALLVTRLPTHTQVLNDSMCVLAPAEPEGFGDAIVQLALDHDKRRRLGEAGREFVEKNHRFAAHQQRVDGLYAFVERELSAGGVSPPGQSSESIPVCRHQRVE